MANAGRRSMERNARQQARLGLAIKAGMSILKWKENEEVRNYVIFGTPYKDLPKNPQRL